ncbi:unnamed protein product [Phytophthora lilii]|uniref:Unnamed protein product n=1 Tax=Phytophthora lilii TaxID=2077276 RepID=A0A9W6WM97_9STRA|nr:unnamed protein product [Phytophthora lilii]
MVDTNPTCGEVSSTNVVAICDSACSCAGNCVCHCLGGQHFLNVFKPHLYLTCAWNTLYRAGIDEASRRSYQRDTIKGSRRVHVKKASYSKRYGQALIRSVSFTIVAIVAAAIVHVCTELDALKTNIALLQFSVASVALKTSMLAITKRTALKHLALKQGGTNPMKIYVLTAVPTVLINTQVRLVMMPCAASGSSIIGFLELGLLEPMMRGAKVWHLRRRMKRLESEQIRWQSRKNSTADSSHHNRIVPVSSSSDRRSVQTSSSRRLTRRATLFNSHQSLLHFHAAESHADMCSEYIATVCSTAIFIFFGITLGCLASTGRFRLG